MAEQTHLKKPQAKRKIRPASVVTTRSDDELIQSSSGLRIETQVSRLDDERLSDVQRRALATEIGQVLGNQHLQRAITSLHHDSKAALTKDKQAGALQVLTLQSAPSVEVVQRAPVRADETKVLKSPRFAGDPVLEAALHDRPAMRKGARGEAVMKLQQALIDDGFAMPISTRKTGSPDGRFGRETKSVVKRFQFKHHLGVDGEVGHDTMGKLDTLFAGPKPPEPKPADPHAVYLRKLNQAVALLRSVRFGRADATEKFDTDFWEKHSDPEYGLKLVLKPGKLPSNAIDAMFANLSEWKVDCAEFVQIAEWFALRHAYGADDFNSRVAGLSFDLRPHGSTGIKSKEMYFRDGPGDVMTRSSDHKPEPKSVDELVADAPIGSRVTWTFLKTAGDFHHENTIKLGPDLFAAHGFRRKGNTFTRKQLEKTLAQVANRHPDEAYIAANVFIQQIELYETP